MDNLEPSVRIRCTSPEVVTRGDKKVLFHPHTDYDERIPPSQEEARLMCMTAGQPCPIMAQCLALGLALQAPSGVWGGKVLLDGALYYKEDTHGGSQARS